MQDQNSPVDHRTKWYNSLGAWFCDIDLDTAEKIAITARMILSVAVLVLNHRLIAVPPPTIQGWALTLPASVWFLLLGGLSAWHILGRDRIDFLMRHRAALGSGLVIGALCGSLWLRAPTVLVMVVPMVIGELTIAARLKIELKNAGN
jgi:hypothetical protein